MPRTPAAKSASRAAPAAAKPTRVAKPVKAVAKPAKPAKPAAKTSVKAVVKSAAKALASSPARKPAAPRAAAKPPVVPIVERAPAVEARPALVRDSFTMPENEYAVLLEVKQACLRAGVDVKKSELLRIGVALLGQLDVATLQGVLAALPQLKTGRPPAQE
jgi:hypothetical protein